MGVSMSKWVKYRLDDFPLTKNGKPFLYANLVMGNMKGQQPRKKPVFFPSKVLEDGYFIVPRDVIEDLEMDPYWETTFPSAVEEVAEEAYAVIKTEAPFGAKSFTVVGDKATAARVARIKNRTVEDDDKHTYIYRKMDEANSEKYNIPVNEGVNNMGLVDKILALDGENRQEEVATEGNYTVARPNSSRLLEMLDDYLDGKTLAEELINWLSDDEIGRFAEEYGYFPDEPEEEVADEGLTDGDKDSYLREIAYGDFETGQTYNNDDFGLFKKICSEDGYEVTEEDFNKYFEFVAECREGKSDSESLDEKEGRPTKSATELEEKSFEEYERGNSEAGDEYLREADRLEKIEDNSGGRIDNSEEIEKLELAAKEEFDPIEKEIYEAMNKNSITDFQASVSDSINRIGSLGTIQLLLDSDLADSFKDELFFIKNTYDLSDTQLVSQAILDAGETLLEDWEVEQASETLKNSSEEENEEEFSEYEEPENSDDWGTLEETEGEEIVEEPEEGEEITEEETEVEETGLEEEENI